MKRSVNTLKILVVWCLLLAAPGFTRDLLENYFNLGREYYKESKYEDSLFNFLQARDLCPQSPEILNNIGLCQEKLKKYSDAKASYEKALEIIPDYCEALNNLGLLLIRQHIADSIGQSLIVRALELSPDNPEYFASMGESYYYQENYQKAQSWFEKALKGGVNRTSLDYLIGLNFLHLGKKREALDSFKSVLKKDPDFISAYIGVVKILEKWEDYEGAKNYLSLLDSQALLKNPDPDQIRQVYDFLNGYYQNSLLNLGFALLNEVKNYQNKVTLKDLAYFTERELQTVIDISTSRQSGDRVLTQDDEVEPAVFYYIPEIKNAYMERSRQICYENQRVLIAADFLFRLKTPEKIPTKEALESQLCPEARILCPQGFEYQPDRSVWKCERHGSLKSGS
ncbi:MAG: tetratricopeptide repeat protein [Candidatus Wallbacteria bacterium]|nr:tetratricopeptide repeat protein [Candidatus Wallbacteria bacterium]